MEVGLLPTKDFGDRVRAMRIERNLSQDGLAALMPSRRHLSWVSKVEKGAQEPSLEDLSGLASALRVDVRWLLTGEESGDSEFIARMRGYEQAWAGDERAERTVLAVAEQQAEEASRRAAAMRRLLADPAIQARYEALLAEEAAIQGGEAGASEEPGESEQPRRRRGQG